MPGRRNARTSTIDVFGDASTSFGLVDPAAFISANSTARCGVGGGSEPVPARPVTNETASIFT